MKEDALRNAFISASSGLAVQLIPTHPGHPYAALVAASWAPARIAYVVAGQRTAYAFLTRELANELERPDLGAITRAFRMAESRSPRIQTVTTAFPTDGEVTWSLPTEARPDPMPPELWSEVTAHIAAADAEALAQDVRARHGHQADLAPLARELLDLLLRRPGDDAPVSEGPFTYRVHRSNVLVKRGRDTVGRYYGDSQVLVLADEADRRAATQFLAQHRLRPRQPLNGWGPARLLAQVAYYDREGVFFIACSHPATQERLKLISAMDGAYIAAYYPDPRQVTCVADAWRAPVRELLEAHGLPVEGFLDATRPDGYSDWTVERLAWHRGQYESWAPSQERPALAPAIMRAPSEPVRKLLVATKRALPVNVADAVQELFEMNLPDRFSIAWPPGHVHWASRAAVLDESQLAALAAVVPPIQLSQLATDVVERAYAVAPAHAPLLAARQLHDVDPAWWESLRWTDRDLSARAGRGTQGLLNEMTDRQIAQSSQPALVGLLNGWCQECATSSNPDLDWSFGQNNRARLWLAVAALRQGRLISGASAFEPRKCVLCRRKFPVGVLALETLEFTGCDRVCRSCADWARFGVDHPQTERRRSAINDAIVALAEIIGGPPARPVLEAPLVVLDDKDLARQLALRVVLPPTIDGAQLAAAGVLADGWRPSRGIYSTAHDGHPCRSLLERHIDDFLSAHSIDHEIEPPYPLDLVLNTTGLRADWLLPGGVLVEAVGMDTEAYLAKIERKKRIAFEHGRELVTVTPKDLQRLRVVFARWL